MKDVMTPFFETSCMEKRSAKDPVEISKPLDVKTIFYDIDKRNALVFKPRNPFDED